MSATARFLCAALACGATAASGTALHAAPASVTLGELTLAYDTAQWRVDTEADGLVLTCLTDSCARVAFEAKVAPSPDSHCGKEEAEREAERRFGLAAMRYTNIYPAGELAVVMTQSVYGSSISNPTAVFACVTRNDMAYNFASRLTSGPYPVHTDGILLTLLHAARVAPAPTKTIRVGDVLFSYPNDTWRHVALADGDPEGALLFCNPPTCGGWGQHVSVRITDGSFNCFELPSGDGDPFILDLEPFGMKEDPGRIDSGKDENAIHFRVATLWDGCRNLTAPRQIACAKHRGKTYVVDAPGSVGCSSAQQIPDDAFAALLLSARPAP